MVIIKCLFPQIFEEEGLLAVALFPLLSELIIYSNPLTTQKSGKLFIHIYSMYALNRFRVQSSVYSSFFPFCCHFNECSKSRVFSSFYYFCVLGDPPMLTWFLQDRLGIKIRRRKSVGLVKPHFLLPVNPKRKVIYPFMKLILFTFIMPGLWWILNHEVRSYWLIAHDSKSDRSWKSHVFNMLLYLH